MGVLAINGHSDLQKPETGASVSKGSLSYPGQSLGVLPLCTHAVGVFCRPFHRGVIKNNYIPSEQGEYILTIVRVYRPVVLKPQRKYTGVGKIGIARAF